MDYYLDSNDYADVLNYASQNVIADTERLTEFLSDTKRKLLDVMSNLKLEFARREEFRSSVGADDYQNPEELSDFDEISDDLAELNYGAWDTYVSAISDYDQDTRLIYDMIGNIQSVLDMIGGIE